MSVTTETFYDVEQRIWHGPRRAEVYGPQATLVGEILKVLEKNPDKVFEIQDADGQETTAAELLRNCKKIANEFLKVGVVPGDIIGLYASNTKNLSAIVVAALLCGTPWNAIYPEYDKAGIKQVFELTTPKIICCELENYETLKGALEEMNSQAKVYTINGKIPHVCSIEEILNCSQEFFNEESFPGLRIDVDATATILCSSGTTGRPKGVLVSHRALLSNSIYRDVSPESVLFCYSTLFWVSGAWTLFASLLNGAKYVITKAPATPESFLNLAQKYGITHTLVSTTFLIQLAQDRAAEEEIRLSSVHCFLIGGSKVPTNVAETAYKLFGLNAEKPSPIICYGLTELGGMLSQTHINTAKRRYDSEGKLMPNMEARIVDRDTGASLEPTKSGFILVRSPYKWAGYYHNPEATQEIYENGWINTRDIGYFDDEGDLHISARESDIFKSYSFQINPHQLEELLVQMPGVSEACVFGVPDSVATYLTACAVVRQQSAAGAKITADQVKQYVDQHAIKIFKLSGGVYFLEELPKTASGKLQRRKVYDFIKKQNA